MFLIISLIFFTILLSFSLFVHLNLEKKRKYKDLTNKHVVVTGGSSGIGKASALEAATLGAHVTVIGRDVGRLQSTVEEITQACSLGPEQKIQYLQLDVTSEYELINTKLTKLETDVAPIFMLVNCAGMCICGQFDSMKPDDIKTMIDLNYFGTANPTRFVLQGMKERNEGLIVFVSSEAALIGIYGYTAYSAAKWAVRGLAESLFMELVGTNLRLTLAFPPDTDTPGFKQEELTKPKETKLISGTGGLKDPNSVGKQIIHDSLNGKMYSVFGASGQMMTLLNCSAVESVGQVLTQVFSMGLLRAIMVGAIISFNNIVKDGVKEKEDKKVK